MSSELTKIMMKSGLLPENSIAEFSRWGAPIQPELAKDIDPRVSSPEALCAAIDEAIQSAGYVLLRETDLEAIPQYLKTMAPGTIHIVNEEGQDGDFQVYVGKSVTGEWIIPWKSESIVDLLTNGQSYLLIEDKRVFFNNVRELFYGDNKAFMVCAESVQEPHGRV